MTFAGLPRESQRADVIAYLNSLSDNPKPLPKAAEAAGVPQTSPRRRSRSRAIRAPSPTPKAPRRRRNSDLAFQPAAAPRSAARGIEGHFVARRASTVAPQLKCT